MHIYIYYTLEKTIQHKMFKTIFTVFNVLLSLKLIRLKVIYKSFLIVHKIAIVLYL